MVGTPERYRRLIQEVAAVYDWIEARRKEEPGRAGPCDACGACCDFPTYDHRLYVTPPELIYLAAKLGVQRLRPMAGGRCPYQDGTRCTVHEHRLAGCRIFCCHGDPDWQSELSEAVLRRFKTICAEFGVPYHYQDLAGALGAFNAGICQSASGSCPADRTG